MKNLTPKEMHRIGCRLQAVSLFLRKAGKEIVFCGDSEESVEKQRQEYFIKAAECDAMSKTILSKFKIDHAVCWCGRNETCSVCKH